MAVDQIEPVIRDFVADGSNEVLVLKGNWGVGKTHFWNRLIEEQAEEGSVGKEKYSYISLFGVNSLHGLKRSIFTSVVDSSNIRDGGVFSALRGFADKAESIPKVADWSGGAVVEKVLFDGVEDTLVCMDDLERRGVDLKMRDLLGLASMMKEERSCQIVLILNDDALEEQVRDEFGTYGEKLVDLEVEFGRSPGNAFECVFDDSDEFSDILGDCFLRLEIRNVRIIQRLKRLTEKLEPYLDECESQTRIAALETLAMLVWCYYGEKNRSPSIGDLKGAGYAGLTEEEGEWDQLIRDYGNRSFGDLDEVLLDLIEKGYLTQEELQQQIDKIDEQTRANEASRKLTEAWKLYRDSFRNNEGEFVEELIQAVEDTIGYISIQNLDNAIGMLRTMGREDEADNLIDIYVQYHKGDLDKFDLDEMAPAVQNVTDRRLRETLNSVSEKMASEKTLGETLRGAKDQSIIAQSSPEEYYEFFKSA